MRLRHLPILAILSASPIVAQQPTVATRIAKGDTAYISRDLTAALADYKSALADQPGNYEALWKAASASVELGEFDADVDRRTALFVSAEDYARKAIAANPRGADGHFQLARAAGRHALTLGARDKVKYGTLVHDEALAALAIDPKHPGALHVMGEWNAEIMRLNWAERTLARTIMGGKVMGEANWVDAQKYMEESVAAEPNRITHRLDLGRVYVDVGDKAKARAMFEWIARAPVTDYNDPNYKKEAAEALAKL